MSLPTQLLMPPSAGFRCDSGAELCKQIINYDQRELMLTKATNSPAEQRACKPLAEELKCKPALRHLRVAVTGED